MHAQFSLLFGLQYTMVLLSKLSWEIKLNTVKDNPEKTLRKNLTTTPFSYINDASVDLNLSLPESEIDRVLWGDSTFWVCGRNPMMWPFKCKLSACTYTRCYLFFRIWENEMVTFGWNFRLAKFSSEKVERSLSPYNLPLSKGTSYWLCCPMRICIHCRKWYEESFHRNRLL